MNIVTEKKCSKCGIVKNASEFYVARGKKSGLFSRCKECDKKVYLSKKDKILAYQREYYKKNREYVIDRTRQYYSDLKTNRHDELLARKKRYEKTPKGKEINRIKLVRRRTRIKGLISDLTTKQVRELLIFQKNKCVACGKDLSEGYHIDHIVPVSKGGGLTLSNVQLLCAPCNWEKHDKTIDYIGYYRETGLYMKERN